jgi:predicted phosphoadenosine phosphosulfate sulfurtransferase
MKVPGDLTDEARFNQSRDRLPWFWVLQTGNSDEPAETLGDDRLKDSECPKLREDCRCLLTNDQFTESVGFEPKPGQRDGEKKWSEQKMR